MLVPFTKKDGGTVFIRAEDIRSIEDAQRPDPATGVLEPSGCVLCWLRHDEVVQTRLQGRAQEVFDGLATEEQRRAEDHYRRQAIAQAGLPVARGRPR